MIIDVKLQDQLFGPGEAARATSVPVIEGFRTRAAPARPKRRAGHRKGDRR